MEIKASTHRTLKIEEHGTDWKKPVKPKIRLMGCWLERAGFKPGLRVQIIPIAPGILELRASETNPST